MVCKFHEVCDLYDHDLKAITCEIDDGGPFSENKFGEKVAYCGRYRQLQDECLRGHLLVVV